jgi:hypothetical protein
MNGRNRFGRRAVIRFYAALNLSIISDGCINRSALEQFKYITFCHRTQGAPHTRDVLHPLLVELNLLQVHKVIAVFSQDLYRDPLNL